VNELAKLAFWFLIGLTIANGMIAITVTFRLFAASAKQASSSDTYLPKATVILSLRGADPFLQDCLVALLNQNYPTYTVQIVVDSREDEAWTIVDKTLSNFKGTTPVKVSVLEVKRPTCSLKCSALIQAIAELDDDCEVVAFVDADTLTHRSWLRELVSPFSDFTVGATTGNRWYVPGENFWGSLVRYLGNIPIVAHMLIHNVPWGGTLAIKTQVLKRTQLLEQWSQGLIEDVIVQPAIQKQGLRVQSIPSLIMLNQEQCSLSSYLPWLKRQLLCVRLYHPSWLFAVVNGTVTTLIPLLGVGLLLMAVINHQWEAGAWVAGGLFCYGITEVLWIVMLEQGVRQILQSQRKFLPEISAITMLKTVIAIPLTQLIFMWAIVLAMKTRKIGWRGITYKIKGPWDIRMVDYHPYRNSKQSDMKNISI
jgi:cellulose synthase/poly-beta-1,6-N-acetylglucosamine synthase-like glycosyltransferase